MGRDLAEDALELSSQDPAAPMSLALLAFETGNIEQAETYLDRLLEIMAHTSPGARIGYAFPSMLIPYANRVGGVSGRLCGATEAARIVLTSHSSTPLLANMARCSLGLRAIVQGDAPAAAEQHAALKLFQGSLLPFYFAGDRILGLLAQVMGNLEQAAEHFEDALAFCRKAGYRPELAWSCCDYADTLLQRDDPGDREQAMSLLEESLAISTELGMRPLMDRVLSRREILRA